LKVVKLLVLKSVASVPITGDRAVLTWLKPITSVLTVLPVF
jgi:hypothetical protein